MSMTVGLQPRSPCRASRALMVLQSHCPSGLQSHSLAPKSLLQVSCSCKENTSRRRRRRALLLLVLPLLRGRSIPPRSRRRRQCRSSSRRRPSCTSWKVTVTMMCCRFVELILSFISVLAAKHHAYTYLTLAHADDLDDKREKSRGDRIGTYVLKETLGVGGFGVVYRACPIGKFGPRSSVALKANLLFPETIVCSLDDSALASSTFLNPNPKLNLKP